MTHQKMRPLPTVSKHLDPDKARILRAQLSFLSKEDSRQFRHPMVHFVELPELRPFADDIHSTVAADFSHLHVDLRAMEEAGFIEVSPSRWGEPPFVRLSRAGEVTLELLEEVLG